MMRLLAGSQLFLLLAIAPAQAEQPRLAEDRIVLRTVAGDAVLALYPDAAPRHVELVLRLARAGCYTNASFFRTEPGSFIELDAFHRGTPLTQEQRDLVHSLPAEISQTLKHDRGTLSMSHDPGDPESEETAFAVILGHGEQRDGEYTIFGRIEEGMKVFDYLAEVPRYAPPQVGPIVRLDVLAAEVVPAAELPQVRLTPPHPVTLPPEAVKPSRETMMLLIGGMALVLVMALAGYAWGLRKPARVPAFLLLIVLVAGFVLLAVLTPYCEPGGWLGPVVFLAALGLFKLMSRFESPG
jgi:cyclophilin family peptidyl-prolyl cis-trans isomerase